MQNNCVSCLLTISFAVLITNVSICLPFIPVNATFQMSLHQIIRNSSSEFQHNYERWMSSWLIINAKYTIGWRLWTLLKLDYAFEYWCLMNTRFSIIKKNNIISHHTTTSLRFMTELIFNNSKINLHLFEIANFYCHDEMKRITWTTLFIFSYQIYDEAQLKGNVW